ncbi:CAZyme family GH31 [Penicillium capsulatum]|uniref:alpha-glucosidase n=1 Tax=Penicillium capsulatum TaxID=69766 RepID=A0A9W9I8B8_9EURO|nr:CAZyme family GH31 [Penicillium capsulatum]KAJ6136146.1 CAZyme family GH31 [Penicillium capsulatum]
MLEQAASFSDRSISEDTDQSLPGQEGVFENGVIGTAEDEVCPRGYQPVPTTQQDTAVHLRSSTKSKTPFEFSFETIRQNLFRVTFTSPEHSIPPFPSVQKPSINLQNVNVFAKTNDTSKTIEVGGVSATVDWEHTPVVSLAWTGSKSILHRDLPLRSYVADANGVAHYSIHDRDALHVGLGEKSAPMDLSGRTFQLSATDCFGYDVYNSDPLYKHIPLLIKATPEGCVAIFSTTHGRGSWSVGAEIDGLWGHFKVYRQDYGGLEQYMIVGKTIRDVVRSYAELVGFPLLVPRWAYGYISGGYKYTMLDEPKAHLALLDFAEKCKEHGIPVSAHQMSSGYSIAAVEPKVRNVFTWNYSRFPDPEGWISKMHDHGIRLITNIKPFLLASHPDFQKLIDARGFFTDPESDEPGFMRLWSAGGATGGDGCHIDFTSEAAFKWWYNGVQSLKKVGIDGMWNDNNEYTLPNDDWTMALDNSLVSASAKEKVPNNVGQWGRAIHTELMGKSSHDALLDIEPKYRPFVLTRSATAGTMRYSASTWSGDNVTSWENMKGSNALSLNAGISLLQCEGHDIGGPPALPRTSAPLDPTRMPLHPLRHQLLQDLPGQQLRRRSHRAMDVPRNHPLIRAAIKRRYEILPYIYSLGLDSHNSATPPQRWIGWGYESDPEVWTKALKTGEGQFWFGDTVLVGGVYEPGQDSARIYLPRKSGRAFDYGYVNLNAPYNYLVAGQWAVVPASWRQSIPLLAKIGGAIPVGKSVHTRVPGDETAASRGVREVDDYRGVEIFPPSGSSHARVFENVWMEDDGISLDPGMARYTLRYRSTDEKVYVEFERDEVGFVPAWKELDVILHCGDGRRVVSSSGQDIVFKGVDERGRNVYTVRA